jgi:SelR domain
MSSDQSLGKGDGDELPQHCGRAASGTLQEHATRRPLFGFQIFAKWESLTNVLSIASGCSSRSNMRLTSDASQARSSAPPFHSCNHKCQRSSDCSPRNQPRPRLWERFWQPIAKENVVEIRDSAFGMDRTAISCRECDAHLGHVFEGGPRPTGLRYSMNSAAMRFIKSA